MSYAPKTIAVLAAYWVQQGGVNLGIVGDLAHQARATYHNGADVINKYGRTAATDYSIRTARDRAGLSNAASALDLGKLHGGYPDLRAFSRWFVERCRASAPGTRDVREFIYSPDGKVVLRWDRERGPASAPKAGEADSTHLYHSHLSFYRDAEARDKLILFEPYFVTPPDTGTVSMGLKLQLTATDSPTAPWSAFYAARVAGSGHSAIRVSDMQYLAVADGLDLGVVQAGTLLQPLEVQVGRPPIAGDRTSIVATDINGEMHVLLRSDVALTAMKPPATDTKHKVGLVVDGVVDPSTIRDV